MLKAVLGHSQRSRGACTHWLLEREGTRVSILLFAWQIVPRASTEEGSKKVGALTR